MDLEITQKDETPFRLSEFGINVKDIIVESIEIDDNYEDKENHHGRLLLSSQYRKRKITVPAFFKVTKMNDIPRMRDLLYGLVVDTDEIYIREIRRKGRQNYNFLQPTEDDYQIIDIYGDPVYDETPDNYDVYVSGKRYQVKCNGVISPEQKNDDVVTFDLEFETVEIPFAESIGTSLELERDLDEENWGYDMGIPFDELEDSRRYTFKNTDGNSVYYFGNIPNDQFNLYKKVTIILGEDTKLFRWNMSYSNLMTIEGIELKKGDKIEYDGVHTYRNGILINDECNVEQPKFRYGWNNFEFSQVVKSIIFDIKFYYK